ncbi:MAG TPA: NADH-quinone oxidoreductase subunit L [Thermodesulfobacteriaceae bacterium]|nr:NADH-quinone oxidoreductase subunit L [Thermodesulfobacteriaceae bacterium]
MPFYLLLIPFLPLASFIFTILFGKRLGEKHAHWVPIAAVLTSFVCALIALKEVMNGNRINCDLYTLISSGSLNVSVGFLLDELTAVMLIVVTSISSLVHIYSVGYMHGDGGYYRFFSFLSLFTFSMLMLVTGNNFIQLFFGWEAVGLSSYLLIGFWFNKTSAADAGKKAFIVNRFGDFGFALGVILIFLLFGTLHYEPVFSQATKMVGQSYTLLGMTFDMPTLVALLLFCGAVGKSAQIPLHVWLPDAMEGPTPVSALIHAATMVTAGVFLVARCNPIFGLSQFALDVVTVVGAVTCLFAATIALVQTDIKRVVAYSTVSQLAYMFIGCGVGAYGAGIFHLFTHAYFKALLFLGCGSVIHAMSDEQDVKYMGGLKKYLPVTYWTMLLASLSISGVPGLAGFFSKDEILAMSYASTSGAGKFAWAIGTLVACMTAFYSFRLFFLTFHGKFRGTEEQRKHLHESPRNMTIPLCLLAFGAVASGWVGIPAALGGGAHWSHFLQPVVGHPAVHLSHATEWKLMCLSVGVGLFGIAAAYVMYVLKPGVPVRIAATFSLAYRWLYNKYYVDELYFATIVQPTINIGRKVLVKVTDGIMIEGIVNGIPKSIGVISGQLRRMQTGRVHHYLAYMASGAFIILFWMLKR